MIFMDFCKKQCSVEVEVEVPGIVGIVVELNC